MRPFKPADPGEKAPNQPTALPTFNRKANFTKHCEKAPKGKSSEAARPEGPVKLYAPRAHSYSK